jgi:hypothetical protein
MEFFTILLSGLLGLLSPVGTVTEQIAEDTLRQQIESAEELAVRIDNTPNYQLARGQIDRIRIAGRGIVPVPDVRIAVLDIETDAVAIDLSSLNQRQPKLNRPLQVAARLVLRQDDLNRALRSPPATAVLRDLGISLSGPDASAESEQYEVINPRLNLLDANRLRLQLTLREQGNQTSYEIAVETGLQINSGRQLQLVTPSIRVNDQATPTELVELLTSGIDDRFDLGNLEEFGITARILKLEIKGDELTLVSFVRVDPTYKLPEDL